jgi:hypothetical protein
MMTTIAPNDGDIISLEPLSNNRTQQMMTIGTPNNTSGVNV